MPASAVSSHVGAIAKKMKCRDQKPERIVILGEDDQNMVTIIKKGTPKEEIKRRVDKVISKSPKRDIMEYAGKLKTDVGGRPIDPLEYQRQMRDEWE